MNISLASPVPALCLAVAAGGAAIAGLMAHRAVVRALVGVLSVAMLCGAIAAGINAYFDYLPTTDAVAGRVARDSESRSAMLRVEAQAAANRTIPHGAVESEVVPGLVSRFRARNALVYLPPAWFRTPRPALPVLMLLHGTPGAPADWTRGAAADVVADQWAAAHGGLAPIMVMPDINGGFLSDTECLDGPDGHAETYLTVDVPAWITSQFGTERGPQHWAIAGLSEGGYCAAALALDHPNVFGSFADFGGRDGATFPPWAHSPPASVVKGHALASLLAGLSGKSRPSGWFEVGKQDGRTTTEVIRSARLAVRAGVPTHLVIDAQGRHTFRFFHRALGDAFAWLATDVGLTPTPTVRR